jgi:hypothetical protein
VGQPALGSLPHPAVGRVLVHVLHRGQLSPGRSRPAAAVSNNLYDWIKYPDPVYHPDTSWAIWNSNTFCHGRDPHVMLIDGTYYMFVTAQHEWYKGAVACATSTDLIHWTDQGFIYLHNSWHMLESVFILPRNGLYHMFFTEEGVYGTQHMSSPTLFGGLGLQQGRLYRHGSRAADHRHAVGADFLATFGVQRQPRRLSIRDQIFTDVLVR